MFLQIMSPETLTFVAPLLSAIASAAAVKATLNGTREDVREIKESMNRLNEHLTDVRERIAALESVNRHNRTP